MMVRRGFSSSRVQSVYPELLGRLFYLYNNDKLQFLMVINQVRFKSPIQADA